MTEFWLKKITWYFFKSEFKPIISPKRSYNLEYYPNYLGNVLVLNPNVFVISPCNLSLCEYTLDLPSGAQPEPLKFRVVVSQNLLELSGSLHLHSYPPLSRFWHFSLPAPHVRGGHRRIYLVLRRVRSVTHASQLDRYIVFASASLTGER